LLSCGYWEGLGEPDVSEKLIAALDSLSASVGVGWGYASIAIAVYIDEFDDAGLRRTKRSADRHPY
jgi:hypothetical protein